MHDLAHVCFAGADLPQPSRRTSLAARRSTTPGGHAPSISNGEILDPFLHWLLAQAGLNPFAYRSEALHRRMAACLRACQSTSAVDAQKRLAATPRLFSDTLDRALIGVSAFFRDPKVFASLRDLVLPDLLQAKPALRVCSLGAADGQELVSVAILLAERNALDGCELVGVDCRPAAVGRAQSGRYDEIALRDLPAEFRARYFGPTCGQWKVRPELERVLHWRRGDVLTFRDPKPWDIILFRNVSIYLTREHGMHAWQNLAAQLGSGGCIVTTAAEKPPAGLRLERVAPAVYRRK